MTRLLFLLPLLLFSCIIAAIYGAVHNQISYSVSPGYFHEFKFIQFGVAETLHTRSGASVVGAFASWWMGLVLGIPIFLASLFVRGDGLFWRSFMKAAVIVVCVTLLVGLGALLVSLFTITSASLPPWMDGRAVSDPVAFARAGNMHNFSYIGGLVGAGVGLGYMFAVVIASRRSEQSRL